MSTQIVNESDTQHKRILHYARLYAKRGLRPVPLRAKSKQPKQQKWPQLLIEAGDVDRHFHEGDNLGLILGEPSKGIVDVDLDSAEAIRLAPHILPQTGWTFGRPSKPASHWLFQVTPLPTTIKYADPDGSTLCELRSTGAQTMFPPSIHPSGERVQWKQTKTPAKVDGDKLTQAVSRLAAAMLLARYWPNGTRHEAALAVSGWLLLSGWKQDEVKYFVEAICDATGDEEVEDRLRAVETTAEKVEAGEPVSGRSKAAELFGKATVKSIQKWLGLSKGEKRSQKTISQMLVEIALQAELFHDPDGNAYATVNVGEHRENWPVRAKGFKSWLRYRFYQLKGKAPASQALSEALGTIEAQAVFEGPEHPVFMRVAEPEGTVYIDLGNDKWEAVEVTSTGWRVVADPPVRFRRAKGMLPLPRPVAGGSIDELKPFLNLANDDAFVLLTSWLVAAFKPSGPYPVLGVWGEQGSAKSTAARVLRSLVDPSTVPLRTTPKEERDLVIHANNARTLVFDNLSRCPPWLSDALCRLATGGGFGTRKLYEDDEEALFEATRPVLLNGIEGVLYRNDLLDRALLVTLPEIQEENRKEEQAFWTSFEQARPRIFGALLSAVSAALRNVDKVKLKRLPRMADFAKWITAAEPALGWKSGTFLKAYRHNRSEAVEVALESDPVSAAVQGFLSVEGAWRGTASDLLERLRAYTPDSTLRTKAWPSTVFGKWEVHSSAAEKCRGRRRARGVAPVPRLPRGGADV